MTVHGLRSLYCCKQENLKSYFTGTDKTLFGLAEKRCRKLVFHFPEKCDTWHSFNNDTKIAVEDCLVNFMKKHKFSVIKTEATSIAIAKGFT